MMMVDGNCIIRVLTTLTAAVVWTGTHVDAVRCFCDKRNCDNSLVCDGKWCLVGFKNDVRLDQMCATDDAEQLQSCETKFDNWEEVCSCQRDFCNTFNFLRTQMDLKKRNGLYNDNGNLDGPGNGKPVPDYENRGVVPNYQNNQLIILLVVVPLGVGASAVCLVFLNYHCKMC